ncbi:hypothetical protein DICVIV_02620 [Dictyocaulus viviparus]|uniref:Acyltransferase 3 domain-containing protein n=1 Tax=Dictyocaulus viviparus TaxID=29172 RepID=A0A0D8Y3I0_DICVI|nr:hypothetical protein DICVIV_02620 [Dictyocaulus viviparus]
MMVFGTLYDLFVYQKESDKLAITREKNLITNDDESTGIVEINLLLVLLLRCNKRNNVREAQMVKVAMNNFRELVSPNQLNWFIRMILAYSVYTNGVEILRTSKKEGEVDCLHGIRFLSMCWIILGHTYYYIGTSLTTDNLIPTLVDFPKSFYTQIIVQAPLAVDSFFLLSGLLASYLFFKKLIKVKTIHSATNPQMWLMIFIKRYTRITPTYAVIMLFDVTLFTYVSSGPFWRPIEKQGCRISWWTNFLYMNNFLLQNEECLSKEETKKATSQRSSIELYGLDLNDYPPAPILTTKLQIPAVFRVNKLDSYWNDVYVRPYIRCGPFIVGVVVGFLLIFVTRHQKDNVLKISKTFLSEMGAIGLELVNNIRTVLSIRAVQLR